MILAGVRGRERQPGELRTTQNWIGSPGATIEKATFVPPPPAELGDLLSDLERFIHEEPRLPGGPITGEALIPAFEPSTETQLVRTGRSLRGLSLGFWCRPYPD